MHKSLEEIATRFDSKKDDKDFSLEDFLKGYGIEPESRKGYAYAEFLYKYDHLNGPETDYLIPIPENKDVSYFRILRNAFLGGLFGWAVGPPTMIPLWGFAIAGVTQYIERNKKDKEVSIAPIFTYASLGALAGFAVAIPLLLYGGPESVKYSVTALSTLGAVHGFKKSKRINDGLFYGRLDDEGKEVFGYDYNERKNAILYPLKRRKLLEETENILKSLND